MKKLLYIFLFILSSQFCKAQDSASYFNKTLPKNAVTGSLYGESGYCGIGYERNIYNSKIFRLQFSTKIGPYFPGVLIPVGVLGELGNKRNKLVGGIHLGNLICPTCKYSGMKDVRRIENNPSPLKVGVMFAYVPYVVATIGYKRYLNTKHALSFNVLGGIYPEFELYFDYDSNMVKAKLKEYYVGWGSVSYYRLF